MVRDIDVRNLIDSEGIKDMNPDQFLKFIQANYGMGLVKFGREAFANDENPEITAVLLGEIYAQAMNLEPESLLSEEGEEVEIDEDISLDDVIVMPAFDGFIDEKKINEVTQAAINEAAIDEDVMEVIRQKTGEEKTDSEIRQMMQKILTPESSRFISTWLTLNALLAQNQSRNMAEDTGDAEVDFGNPDAAEDYDTWAEWQDKNAMLKSSWFRILKRD